MSGLALAVFAVVGAVACVDALEDAIPVVRLEAPPDPIELTLGATQTVYVQALGADGQGVTGARIIFIRADDERIAFDGASDGTDAVSAKTADSDISGLSTKGTAVVELRTLAGATPGYTFVTAVAKEPTSDPAAALVARLEVHIVAANTVDGGVPDAGDASDSDASGDLN